MWFCKILRLSDNIFIALTASKQPLQNILLTCLSDVVLVRIFFLARWVMSLISNTAISHSILHCRSPESLFYDSYHQGREDWNDDLVAKDINNIIDKNNKGLAILCQWES